MVLHPGVIPQKGKLETPKTCSSWGTRLPRAPIHSAFRAQNIQLQTQLLHHRVPSPGTAPSGCSRTRRCCRNISAFQHLSATSPSPELGWEPKFTLLYPIPMLLTMQRLRVSQQGGERWPSPVPWHCPLSPGTAGAHVLGRAAAAPEQGFAVTSHVAA